MRYSIIFASAYAASAAAMPWLNQRAIVTRLHTATAIETVLVVVTVTRESSPGSPSPSTTSTDSGDDPITSTVTVIVTPSSLGSQPSMRFSTAPVSKPTDVVGPIGGSSTSSTLFTAAGASPSSGVALLPSVGVSVSSSPLSPASSAASIASAAASPPDTSSTAVAPASTSPSAAPSASPAGSGQSHLTGPDQAFLSSSSGIDYQNAVLYHHNAARANNQAAPLTWNTSLVENAQYTANTCDFAHSIPPGVSNGQNLFTVSGDAFNVTAGITESWYKAEFPFMEPWYGVANLPDAIFHQVGHMTQLVWQSTTSVGCVSIDCGDRMKINGQSSALNKFTVCNYYPPGNIVGDYNIGVLRPLSTTNLGSWTD